MHEVTIREHIVERVLARRGRLHLYDSLDPKRTAFVIIDMINMFVEPGAPAEVPASRGIVADINALTEKLRPMGCRIVWDHQPDHDRWRDQRLEQVLRQLRQRGDARADPGRERARQPGPGSVARARDRGGRLRPSRRTDTAR